MRVLYVADRLSVRGGADLHLRQVIDWALGMGWRVDLAVGRTDSGLKPPHGVHLVLVRGLAASTPTQIETECLRPLMASAEIVHVHNVMNPTALRLFVDSGKAVVTVQDHRVFCPGLGKTLPDGTRCRIPMGHADCSVCLEDETYRRRMEDLTSKRLEALRGASLVVLSHYMAEEMAAVGCGDAAVIPPWVEPGSERTDPGGAFVLAGRLVCHKGVMDGWRAWFEAGRPLPLRVMGEGTLGRGFAGAECLGWLDHPRCLSEISRARALLFPSFWQEPFGILGIEALSQGTPVIAVPSGGMEDWVDRGCIRVSRGDASAFAQAISHLAGDPGGAQALGEAGRVMVGERFSRRALAPRLEALYEGARTISRV